MRASQGTKGVPDSPIVRLLALAVTTVLAGACIIAATPSPTGSPAAASPTGSVKPGPSSTTPSPAPSATPFTAPTPAPTPMPSAEPDPTYVPVTRTTAPCPPALPSAGGRWQAVASLPVGSQIDDGTDDRTSAIDHAFALADGRVLVVQSGGAAATWSPGANRWTAVPSLNKARTGFAAIELADGRVMVTGGLNQEQPPASFSSTYVFDPRPGHETWDRVGLMNAARTVPAITLLQDGRVLVAGGYFWTPQEWGRANPDGGEWSATAQLAAFRPPLADVEVPPHGYALATAEIFDPATGTWSKTGSMRYARMGDISTTLSDGRVLVVGSSSGDVVIDGRAYRTAEIYDPATGRWSLTGSLPPVAEAQLTRLGIEFPGEDQALAPGTLTPLDDGGAVLIGLSGWWKHQGELTRSFRYDAAAGTWREIWTTWLAGYNAARTSWISTCGPRLLSSTVVKLRDGRVLIAGGGGGVENAPGATRVALVYDPVTDRWAAAPDAPTARVRAAAVLLPDGSVLVVGGAEDEWSASAMQSAERYLPGS